VTAQPEHLVVLLPEAAAEEAQAVQELVLVLLPQVEMVALMVAVVDQTVDLEVVQAPVLMV
jgi:hypothetical protein